MGRYTILVRIFLVVVAIAVSAVASAQSPYVINGLNSDLLFTAAVAQAEKLGGVCQRTTPGANEVGISAHCEYIHCDTSDPIGECEAGGGVGAAPMVAAHEILRVLLEAPAESARLTSIAMVYNGDTETLAAGLIETFGATESNGAPTGKKSWSHARRWSWRTGLYRMGLLDSPPLILLATDQAPAPPAAETGLAP